jgi:hypothetical protein
LQPVAHLLFSANHLPFGIYHLKLFSNNFTHLKSTNFLTTSHLKSTNFLATSHV